MTLAVAAVVASLIALPHLVDLRKAEPLPAALVWLAALGLRAVAVAAAVVAALLYVPHTEVFSAVTHWCWHTVLPLITTHLGLDGHRVGDAAIVFPALILAFSMVSVGFGVARAARAVHRWVVRSSLGTGPSDSIIVGGEEVLVAAAGFRRPRILVSAGALTQLDDEELAAGLEHERGHVARRHRYLFLAAELCRALARFLPGSRRAMREVALHLERDADLYAVRRRHDPLALASAICKAASVRASPLAPSLATLGGAGSLCARLDELTGDAGPPERTRWGARLMATVMLAATLVAVAALPAAVANAGEAGGNSQQMRHCVD